MSITSSIKIKVKPESTSHFMDGLRLCEKFILEHPEKIGRRDGVIYGMRDVTTNQTENWYVYRTDKGMIVATEL